MGAGGGGFLMFYTQEKAKLRYAMKKSKLEEIRFKFDYDGTKRFLDHEITNGNISRWFTTTLRPLTKNIPKAIAVAAGTLVYNNLNY